MADVPSDLAGLLGSAYRYDLALTHDGALADELLQQACLSMLKAGAPWEEGYLLRAVRTRYIDHGRSQRATARMNNALRLGAVGRTRQDQCPTEREDQVARLHRALGCLRSEEREVLFLHVVAGHTAHRIGEIIERPRSTVLSLLQRGRRKLYELLQDDALEVCNG